MRVTSSLENLTPRPMMWHWSRPAFLQRRSVICVTFQRAESSAGVRNCGVGAGWVFMGVEGKKVFLQANISALPRSLIFLSDRFRLLVLGSAAPSRFLTAGNLRVQSACPILLIESGWLVGKQD